MEDSMENDNFNALPKKLQEALKRSDVLVGKQTLEYYYNLYDPRTGGFYYSISSRDMEKMTPFAEGTYFVLNALRDGGITPPDWYKEKVSAWLLPHQDEGDGYFYEELWGKITQGTRRINRDLTYSTIIIKSYCGKQPLYPTPEERIKTAEKSADGKSSATPEFLSSKEKFLEHLKGLNWNAPYGTGSTLATQASLIKAAGLFDVAADFIASIQNPETGLWGEGLGWENTNAAMKLATYFQDTDHPYPRIEKLIESVQKIFESGVDPNLATHIWNPFVALTCAFVSVGERADELRPLLYEKGADIVNFAIDAAEKLRKPDGGFSSFQAGSIARQQGYLFGAGLPYESDLDGTVIAGQLLRAQMHRVFGVTADHTYLSEYGDDFWERCKNKPPIVKTMPRGNEALNPQASPKYYEPQW